MMIIIWIFVWPK